MKLCQYVDCANWAQWRATWPDKVLKILCNLHKEGIRQPVKDEDKIKFVFVGAFPDHVEERVH